MDTTVSLLDIKIGLSFRSFNNTRKVLRYDDFLGNIVGYLSNIIIVLYIFNVFYNSFGARVYFAKKFFLQNREIQTIIVEELRKKIGKNIYYPTLEKSIIDQSIESNLKEESNEANSKLVDGNFDIGEMKENVRMSSLRNWKDFFRTVSAKFLSENRWIAHSFFIKYLNNFSST
jgi:hypothetical protein